MANWQVISLDTTTPQLRAPGTGDGYSFNSGSTTLGTWTTTGLTLSTGTLTVSSGTANGVLYLNGSKVATSGSALTFDGAGVFKVAELSGNASLQLLTSGSGGQLAYIQPTRSGSLEISSESSSPSISFKLGTSAPTSEKMRLTSFVLSTDSSINVGIGTASPAVKLAVVSTGSETFSISGGGTSTQYQRFNTTGGNYYIGVSSSTGTGLLSGASNYSMCLVTESARDMIFGTNNTERLRLDSSGNAGLNVTPSAWVSYKALQVASIGGAFSSSSSSDLEITTNAYYSGGWLSQGAGVAASRYRLQSGTHSWWTSTTNPGAAGNPITFTQIMTLTAAGDLGVGTTSPTTFGAGSVLVTSAGTTTYGGFIGSTNNVTVQMWADEAASAGSMGTRTNHPIRLTTNNTERARIPAAGGMVVGTAALATNATDGFLYIPGCAGTPTGTPTAYTGRVPLVVDTTNNKLYFYSSGAWRDAGP